jgi:hypothetical protein
VTTLGARIPNEDCEKSLVIDWLDDQFIGEGLVRAGMGFNLPFGIFIATSFGSTVIFYVSFYIFLLGAYGLRMMSQSILWLGGSAIDLNLARDHAVLVAFIGISIFLAFGITLLNHI